MMIFKLNFVLLASLSQLLAVRADMLEVQSALGEDGKLQCTAHLEPGVQYRAVRWYKINKKTSQQNGLLTQDLPNGTTKWYVGVEREVELLEESLNIILPNVQCNDSGVYMCYLAAPVGQQIREGLVRLTVTDCPVESTENALVTDAYLVTTAITVLMFALVLLLLNYKYSKKSLKEKYKMPKREVSLDSPPKPLSKKDLMLIYTLGPKQPSLKHTYV